MADLHILVVVDSTTGYMRVENMQNAPVDSDMAVFDHDYDEWRGPTDDEEETLIEAEAILTALLPKPAPAVKVERPKRLFRGIGCKTCASGETLMPPHDASLDCESGGYDHCSCSTCF